MLRRKIVTLSSLLLLVIGGCAGREARPVASFRPGDESLNCAAIDSELGQIKATVVPLYDEAGDKLGWNVGWGLVGGLFFLPALFALDLSDAEKQEIQAYQVRWDSLMRMRNERRCPGPSPEMLDADGEVIRAAAPGVGAVGAGPPAIGGSAGPPAIGGSAASAKPTSSQLWVMSVQSALQEKQYYGGPIDGMVGQEFRQAVMRFQTDRGISVTGKIDAATLSGLGISE